MLPRLRIAITLATVLFYGCGGGGSDSGGVGPDALSPAGFLVGSWQATSLVLTNKANPDESGDIVAQFNAVFTLDVEESGRYLAILSAFGQSSSESGRLTVSGDIVTMRRELPSPQTNVSEIVQEGSNVIMDGDTTFDFNQDGSLEEAILHLVLGPRQ